MAHRLAPLFDFQSIALVGASDTNMPGLTPFRSLDTVGFDGRYYPVNPRREEVHGQRAYPTVASLPETPDMVVVAIARDGVPDVVDECADLGVKAVVINSAGFAEQGDPGTALQARITDRARESGLLVVGPNCLGVASIAHRCAAYGANLPGLTSGTIGVTSNSGGLMIELMNYGRERGLGFSHLVSSGNEAGVTSADVIDYFVADPDTEVILGILEAVRDPELFVAACERALLAGKPIVLVKMGSSEKGVRATMTHTGALSGSDAVNDALFRQKGVIRVTDIDELIDMGALLSNSIRLLRTRRLERAAIIEISGGGKGVASDTAAEMGVDLPDLSEATSARLKASLPHQIFATNPIDTEGSWGDPTKPEVYPLVLEAFGSEPQFDIVISDITPRTGPLTFLIDRLAELDVARVAHPDRLFAILARTSSQYTEEWMAEVQRRHIPFVQGYARGLRAIGRLTQYSRALHGAPPRVPSPRASADGTGGPTGRVVNEVDSKEILRAAGIPVVETVPAADVDEALAYSARIGYPVVLKVIADEIVHKSDAGDVRLGLGDGAAVREAFADIERVAASAGATFRGVAVQRAALPGLEVVLGAHRDPQYGPVLMFGLGGVFVEVLRDVALRVAPLSATDAQSMLDDIRGRELLDGVRGGPPVDRAAIADALGKLSALMLSRQDITDIDINPAFAYPTGLLAVDARIEL